MANRKTTAAATRPAPSEETFDRIRAYLDSMRRLQGCATSSTYEAGRAAIIWIGAQCRGNESAMPNVELSGKACADILDFIGGSEPLEPATWWDDPPDAASPVCGLQAVLYAVECNMRALAPAATSPDQAEPDNKAETPSISEIERSVDRARVVVHMCAFALDAGESDLELLSAKALQRVGEELDELTDELASMSRAEAAAVPFAPEQAQEAAHG